MPSSTIRMQSTLAPPSAADAGIERLGAELAARLGLAIDAVVNDDGDSFVTLKCRDAAGAPLMLKYVSRGSADARRRLENEGRLLAHLPARPPLRLLRARDHGHGYLLTEFDPGVLLHPERMDDERLVDAVVDALVAFQSIRLDAPTAGVADREHLATYYLKVLLKHILHLWPAHMSAREAGACLAAVTAALPAIMRHRVICHGDFLPTNLLFDAAAPAVTLTDLEGFMTANHPLFDVLALFTMNESDLDDWRWQRRFLARYLRHAGASGLDPGDPDFARAYRGILIFFLVYRWNEARLFLQNRAYFEGRGKRGYLTDKALGLVTGRPTAWREDELQAALRTRRRNLLRILSPAAARAHLEHMLS